MGLHLMVVSDSDGFDFTEFVTGLFRFGEIDVKSIDDMVKKVKAKCASKKQKISRLDIYGHGTDTDFDIGKDSPSNMLPKTFSPKFARLASHFADGGYVLLCVCDVGQARDLIIEMSSAFGVPVYANMGKLKPGTGGTGSFTGTGVVGFPDGRFETGVMYPDHAYEQQRELDLAYSAGQAGL